MTPNLRTSIAVGACLAVLASGCSPSNDNHPQPDPAPQPAVQASDALVQFSLVAALAAGDYSGGEPLRNIQRQGDFGVGTFNRLEGEMIVLDGQIHQALATGAVRPANLDGTTPFAAVTFFNEDGRVEKLSAQSLADLDAQLDRALPRLNRRRSRGGGRRSVRSSLKKCQW